MNDIDGMKVLATKGLGWRIAASIIVFFGWLAFLILWLFFYAGEFDVFQNIAIFIISILIGIGVLAAVWASWGIKMARSQGWEKPKEIRPKWPIAVSAVTGIGWLIFLIVWLFFYASDFTGYQNLAIFLLSLLVLGGLIGGSWALWGARFGH